MFFVISGDIMNPLWVCTHCLAMRSSSISFSSAPVHLQSPGSLIYRKPPSFPPSFCFLLSRGDWDQFGTVSDFSAELEKNPADPFLMRILLVDALTQYLLCRSGESQSGGKQVVMETPFKAPCDELACWHYTPRHTHIRIRKSNFSYYLCHIKCVRNSKTSMVVFCLSFWVSHWTIRLNVSFKNTHPF